MGAWKDCDFRVNQEADTTRRKKSILNKGFVVFFFFNISWLKIFKEEEAREISTLAS
jgi:hypothetical protein